MVKQIWDTKQNAKEVTAEKQNRIKTLNVKPNTSLFIYNLNTDEHLTFNLIPDTLQDTYTPTFHAENNIYGRTTPLYFYTGGGGKTLSFSFTLHEDELYKSTTDITINRDIYKYIDKLVSFTEPYLKNIDTRNQTLKEPLVYLQLGEHFSGKGFIEVNWSYRTPFRNNRYILADVGITFTYVVEYEQLEVSEVEIQETISHLQDYLFYPQNIDEELMAFLPYYTDYDYVKTYSLELMTQEFKSTLNNDWRKISALATMILGGEGELPILEYWYIGTGDPAQDIYILMLQSFYIDLSNILHPTFPYNRTKELNTLSFNVRKLETTYKKYGGRVIRKFHLIDPISGSESGYYTSVHKMSEEDKELFEQEIKRLKSMISVNQQVIKDGGYRE